MNDDVRVGVLLGCGLEAVFVGGHGFRSGGHVFCGAGESLAKRIGDGAGFGGLSRGKLRTNQNG